MAYKRDQGRMARMLAFWSMAILLFYGCTSLYQQLLGRLGDQLGQTIGGMRIPLLGVEITGAFLIAAGVFLLAFVILYRWHQSPKTADLLIDTEAEMRKVIWPSLEEALNSSTVVILTVVFLMAFLAGSDFVLGYYANKLLLGG